MAEAQPIPGQGRREGRAEGPMTPARGGSALWRNGARWGWGALSGLGQGRGKRVRGGSRGEGEVFAGRPGGFLHPVTAERQRPELKAQERMETGLVFLLKSCITC